MSYVINFPHLQNLGQEVLADTYNPIATYSIGNYCTYNRELYVCSTAISTAEAWNPAHWTKISVANELESLNSGKVPITRTVNGKALSSDITITQSDLNIVYSATEPQNPAEGTIWVRPNSGGIAKVASFNSGNMITSAGTYTVTVPGIDDYWRPTEIIMNNEAAVLSNWSWTINSSGVCSLTIPSGGIRSGGTTVKFILSLSDNNA